MKFQAVFFDSGGTLYDLDKPGDPPRAKVQEQRFQRLTFALQGFGVSVDSGRLNEAVLSCEADCEKELGFSYNYYRLVMAVCKALELNIAPEEAACLADAYAGPRYTSWLFPGTLEVVQMLSEKGLYLGVIANTYMPGFCMDRAFAGVGLLPYFQTRIYSGDIGIAKPDERIFRLAEKASGCSGRSMLYIGDNLEADIKGASGVGWTTAFRRRRNRSSEGLADFEFDETTALLDFVLGG